jgi:hypothetical protein
VDGSDFLDWPKAQMRGVDGRQPLSAALANAMHDTKRKRAAVRP